MKISYRILIINFAIVVCIIGSSAYAFYSIMYNVLSSQQSKYLSNAANNFHFFYRETIQDTDDDFLFLLNNKDLSSKEFQFPEKNIDFIIIADSKNNNVIKQINKRSIDYNGPEFSVEKFIDKNPYAFIRTYSSDENKIYYYGRIINENVLNEISKKIGAEISLIWHNLPAEISNSSINQRYIYTLTKAFNKHISQKENKIYTEEAESTDILTKLYSPSIEFGINSHIEFLIFTTLNEATDLRNNLKYILIVIGISGVILSLILTLVFTDKIRKQISQLNKATKFTKDGKLKNIINIKSKDELGSLATAFNNMLEVLSKNQKERNEYSEFITLINQNPTLNEISEAALRKIIKTCGFTIGAIYSNNKDGVSLICSYGMGNDYSETHQSAFFQPVIKNKETIELNFQEDLPVIKTGTLSLMVKYLLIIPVIYNNKVIAILELGGIEKLSPEARQYLTNIQEQLAIGLTNAAALVQLENLVKELKNLNEDYQKQNEQVKEQNEILLKLHNELKEKADELTLQKQKAEESTKLKSQFLASISHELRTPMNSILGLSELILEESSISGKDRERLQVVLSSGKRLLNLINEILDLSKIEAGKMEIRTEIINMDEFLKEIDTAIRPLADAKSLKFNIINHSNTGINFKADHSKIMQVLTNLLGNAVKFTAEGKIQLQVILIENNTLRFDIIDTGIGISEVDQKVIFEEFRQLDGSSTRKYNGTGLGLTICKKIADLMQGELSVQSEAGVGSVFSFTISIEIVENYIKSKTIEVNTQVLVKNRNNPVLVIDDDAEVRYTIGQYLKSVGYEVIYAEDGEKGIQEAIRKQPYAITLDIMLPEKDGWNVLKELKGNPETKDIPVILISIISDKNLGFGLGAFEYFIKPVSAQNINFAFKKLEGMTKRKIKKLAIVCEDKDDFNKFADELKNEYTTVYFINDGEKALDRIIELQPDLIISDLIISGTSGIKLAHKLRNHRDTRNIPVILNTSSDLTEDESQELTKIVENITITSKIHPLDVLKIVRDRIKMEEDLASFSNESTKKVGKEVVNVQNEEVSMDSFGEVLIVDDEPDVLFTLSELIQACNCKPILAKSGLECIQILEKKTPDLILLDIMMPEMNGFQTLKKIKLNQRLKNVPVFAVSARAMSEDKAIILKHGFEDFIPKPVDSVIISYKLKKIFNQIRIPENEKNTSC